jgi:hypothetical protein
MRLSAARGHLWGKVRMRPALATALLAALVRFSLVLLLARAPLDDGTFFLVFAKRLAAGQGYTWAWPDGAVTYAAHYPAGFPLMLSWFLRLRLSSSWALAALTALAGAGTAFGAATLARGRTRVFDDATGGKANDPAGDPGERAGWLAGLILALHPALLTYAPAYMSESLAIGLLGFLCGLCTYLFEDECASGRRTWFLAVLAGATLGWMTLVRPQFAFYALGVAWLAVGKARAERAREARRLAETRSLRALGIVAIAACAVVLPWTARNCQRLSSCVAVSANGGWNALIGAQTQSGGYEPMIVPAGCREVWDEVDKDACFAATANTIYRQDMLRAVSQVPKKWRRTFDYFGAGPYWMHTANIVAEPIKLVLGGLETVIHRFLLACGLGLHARAWFARRFARRLTGRGSRTWPQRLWLLFAPLPLLPDFGGLIGAVLLVLFTRYASPSDRVERRPTAGHVVWLAVTVLMLLLVHGAFFGGGRYGLVLVFPVAVEGVVAWVAVPAAGRGSRKTLPIFPERLR